MQQDNVGRLSGAPQHRGQEGRGRGARSGRVQQRAFAEDARQDVGTCAAEERASRLRQVHVEKVARDAGRYDIAQIWEHGRETAVPAVGARRPVQRRDALYIGKERRRRSRHHAASRATAKTAASTGLSLPAPARIVRRPGTTGYRGRARAAGSTTVSMPGRTAHNATATALPAERDSPGVYMRRRADSPADAPHTVIGRRVPGAFVGRQCVGPATARPARHVPTTCHRRHLAAGWASGPLL